MIAIYGTGKNTVCVEWGDGSGVDLPCAYQEVEVALHARQEGPTPYALGLAVRILFDTERAVWTAWVSRLGPLVPIPWHVTVGMDEWGFGVHVHVEAPADTPLRWRARTASERSRAPWSAWKDIARVPHHAEAAR